MRAIRQLIYRLGFRPRPGSIFYSPSLTAQYLFIAAMEAFKRGLESAEGWTKK